jgi:hypothetical protein
VPTPALTFDVVYSPEIAKRAAEAFRSYRWKRYGPLMVTACIVNAIGLAIAIWLGADLGKAATLFVGFVVVFGPLWLLYEHFVWPSRYASKLIRVLPPSGRVSVAPDAVSLATRDRDAEIPWAKIKRVLETQNAFILVLSPFHFVFIPRIGLPIDADGALRARSQSKVA